MWATSLEVYVLPRGSQRPKVDHIRSAVIFYYQLRKYLLVSYISVRCRKWNFSECTSPASSTDQEIKKPWLFNRLGRTNVALSDLNQFVTWDKGLQLTWGPGWSVADRAGSHKTSKFHPRFPCFDKLVFLFGTFIFPTIQINTMTVISMLRR